MTLTRTDATGFVRSISTDSREIEGLAIPYGTVSAETELVAGSGQIVREAWAPGAFRDNVAGWMSRQDGAKLAFRPKHGSPPVGVVTSLEDTPAGVSFRASIFDKPAGNDYLDEVRAGLNGISVEAMFAPGSKRTPDGVVIHRSGRLHAIAGSVTPAYDGARIALRDMEAAMSEETAAAVPAQAERAEAATAVPPMAQAERAEAERADPTVQVIARESAPALRITRAETVYGPRSEHSFLSDIVASAKGDSAAAERQGRHNAQLADVALQIERAGDVLSAEIPGAYPNNYLPGLLTPRILKGRPMGGFYNRVPISDARPQIFAKVTTSTTVAVQSAEGVNPAASDFATTAVTATPLLYGAETVVSRQVLDGASPSGEAMIIQDMLEAYGQASETVIKTAVEAGATASGSAIVAATPYAGLIANIVAYQQARFAPAEGQFIPAALYTTELSQADTTGRALLAYSGPMNASGSQGRGGSIANLLGVDQYLSWASTANVVVTGRPSDYVIYESSIARFSYDGVTGPAGVRMGIWAYLVVGTRLGSLKVTAA